MDKKVLVDFSNLLQTNLEDRQTFDSIINSSKYKSKTKLAYFKLQQKNRQASNQQNPERNILFIKKKLRSISQQ